MASFMPTEVFSGYLYDEPRNYLTRIFILCKMLSNGAETRGFMQGTICPAQGGMAMDFRQLENFIEVSKQLSFTKASNNLYISQQGISKSIKSLEDELGVPLFYRSASTISLTNYGTLLLPYAKELVSGYTAALAEISREKYSLKNTIRVGLTQGMVNFLPGHLFGQFTQNHPDIKLHIQEFNDTDVDTALKKGEIDIGFCVTPIDLSHFTVHHTHVLNTYFMLSEKHPLADRDTIDLRQLKNETFLSFGESIKGHSSFLERCRKAGFVPNIGAAANDFGLLTDLCRQNMGISFYVGEKPVEFPGLRIIPDKLHGWDYVIHICTAVDHGVNEQEAEFIHCFQAW